VTAVSRRDFLRVGGLSALGLTLPGLLKATAEARVRCGSNLPAAGYRRDSALDGWRAEPYRYGSIPKPESTQEIRGPFGAILRTYPEFKLSEHLPKLAKQMDKFSIIRSVTSPDGTH